MDSSPPHVPLPSAAWSHLAASQGENCHVDAAAPTLAGQHSQADDSLQLRARLLRMIVDNEHTRKSAAVEAFNAR